MAKQTTLGTHRRFTVVMRRIKFIEWFWGFKGRNLVWLSWSIQWSWGKQTKTDNEGTFSIDSVDEAFTFKLLLVKDGYLSAFSDSLDVNARGFAVKEFYDARIGGEEILIQLEEGGSINRNVLHLKMIFQSWTRFNSWSYRRLRKVSASNFFFDNW